MTQLPVAPAAISNSSQVAALQQQLVASVHLSNQLAQRPVDILQSLSQGTHDSVDLHKLLELLLELKAAMQSSAELADKLTRTVREAGGGTGSGSLSEPSDASYEIVQPLPPNVPLAQLQLDPSGEALQPLLSPQERKQQQQQQQQGQLTHPQFVDEAAQQDDGDDDDATPLQLDDEGPLQLSHPAQEPHAPVQLRDEHDSEAPPTSTLLSQSQSTGSPAAVRSADETIMEAPLDHKPIEVVIVSNAHENYIQSKRDSKTVLASAVGPQGGAAHVWLLYRVAGPAGEKHVALQNEANGKWLSADKSGALRCDRPWVREWEMWTLVPMAAAQDGRTDPFALSLFALRSFHGQYLSVEAPGSPVSLWPLQLMLDEGACKVVANRGECDAWERLVFMSPDGTCSAAFQGRLKELAAA